MTWQDLYLLCFLVGFALSMISLLAGSIHLHLPHLHFLGHGFEFHGHGQGHGHGHAGEGELSFFNFGTIAAFLAWFGGTGYLLARYSALAFFLALGISVMSGLGGALIVFLFLAKVLMRKDENLNPADYDMIGVLGTVSSRIRTDGTGELIFSQEGLRRSAFARSEDGREIEKGAEVVVTRYEKGIAYVRRWEDLTNAAESGAGAEKS